MEKNNKIIILYRNNKKTKIFVFFLVLLFIINSIISKNKQIKTQKKVYSEKWIVLTTYNLSKSLLLSLIKNIDWKIVLINNDKMYKDIWKKYNNSENLIYLSIKDQLNMGYKIIKYLGKNLNNLKNIGYLYAIEHGAKEII